MKDVLWNWMWNNVSPDNREDEIRNGKNKIYIWMLMISSLFGPFNINYGCALLLRGELKKNGRAHTLNPRAKI